MGTNPYDYRADAKAHQERTAFMAKRRKDAEDANAQANAPETIPATGRHHRKDGS